MFYVAEDGFPCGNPTYTKFDTRREAVGYLYDNGYERSYVSCNGYINYMNSYFNKDKAMQAEIF